MPNLPYHQTTTCLRFILLWLLWPLPPAISADEINQEVLDEAIALYREAVGQDKLRNVVLWVSVDGQVVIHEAFGWRDKEADIALQKNDLFRMASNTKAVVSAAALILADRGQLDLNAPVARYLPGFAKNDLAEITVAQLMSNSSGLPRSPILYPDTPASSNLIIEAERFAERLKLESKPGTAYGYSNVGYNVLGGVIEKISGQRLDQFINTEIYQALGMKASCHHESDVEPGQLSKVYVFNKQSNQWRTRWAPSDAPSYPIIRASGGMISNATDYGRFMQLFLDYGQAEGQQILSRQAVEQATQAQAPSSDTGEYGYGWRIGKHGNFHHSGSDGTYAWADRKRNLVGLIFTQSPKGDNPRQAFRKLIESAIPATK